MRKFSFLFISLVTACIFFAVFYLYYVPSNRENLNKYAFLTLQGIQSDISYKINADIQLYSNHLENALALRSRHPRPLQYAAKKLQERRMGIRSFTSSATGKRFAGNTVINPEKQGTSLEGGFYDIDNGNLLYIFRVNNDSVLLGKPAAALFDEILQAHKTDFFQSFLFLKIKDGKASPVFKLDEPELGTDIAPDSLFARSTAGFYPGITEVPVGDIRYKLFYIHVLLNGRHFALCGFKNAGDYQAGLREISPGFIYPIVILLLLLLLSLPLIKLYMMGPAEKVRISDLVGYFFSLFAGSMFITIIIIQVLLLKDGDIHQHNNLKILSNQISNSFRRELVQAYQRLQELDTLPAADPAFKAQKNWKHASINISGTFTRYMAKKYKQDSGYYNFDRVAWVDDSGRQIIKAQFDQQEALFSDVRSRKYFTNFQTNSCYQLPGNDTAIFSMEAVLNWVDGAFRIIIARPSKCPHAFIATLATNMYSVNHTILPTGFGFCITDANGNVQVHSDSSHNLNENFFEELENSNAVQAAFTGRQQLYVNNIKFYGKGNGMLVTPIQGLPLYLITFYDKGYILPVNMRILCFSLLFGGISFFTCLFIWLGIFWRRYYGRPLLFSPLDYLQWLVPRKKYSAIYAAICLFLGCYILMVLLIISLGHPYSPETNHLVLLLLVLTPMNITFGLIIITRTLKAGMPGAERENNAEDNRQARNALILMIVVYIAGLWYSGYPGNKPFMPLILFQTTLLLLLAGIYFYGRRFQEKPHTGPPNYLFWYSLAVEVLVLCLAVIPASLFTWYAHNKEFLQAIKREQLFMAISLENRKSLVSRQFTAWQLPGGFPALTDTMAYARGIYRINKDSIFIGTAAPAPDTSRQAFEAFYFLVADQFSNNYYSQQALPGLQQGASDRQWYWTEASNDSSMQFYYALPPEMPADARQKTIPLRKRILHISSTLPPRYIFLKDKGKLFMVLAAIVMLLAGVYKLIRRISEGIFLQKYLQYHLYTSRISGLPMIHDYCRQYRLTEADHKKTAVQKNLSLEKLAPLPDEQWMDKAEYQAIAEANSDNNYYAYIISQCTPEEKLLLRNFALNGFLNYKNAPAIYSLLRTGILVIVPDQDIRLFSRGFRAYLLQHAGDFKTENKEQQRGVNSAWEIFKTPFMVLLITAAAFVFLTRQEAWQRISALVAGLSTSLPLLLGLFRTGDKTPPGGKE